MLMLKPRALVCFALPVAVYGLLYGCHRAMALPARPLSQRARPSVTYTQGGKTRRRALTAAGHHDQNGQPPLRVFAAMPNGNNEPVFLHGGSVLRTLASEGTYRFWDVNTGRMLRSQPTNRPAAAALGEERIRHLPYAAVTDDVTVGAQVVTRRDGGADIQIWDIARDRPIRTLPMPHLILSDREEVDVEETKVQFSHDARTCAVCYAGKALTLWNWRAGRVRWSRFLSRPPPPTSFMPPRCCSLLMTVCSRLCGRSMSAPRSVDWLISSASGMQCRDV